MKKLIILQGCPCSGKSTWAKEYQEKNECIIVNRDAIRYEIGHGKYVMNNEPEVTRKEEYQVEQGMIVEATIILDSTNLNEKYLPKWNVMAEKYGYEIEYKKFYIPFNEAMQRSKARQAAGGLYITKEVMRGFYRKYYPEEYEKEMLKTVNHVRNEIDTTLPKAILCDIDGTVAWMQGRSPYDLTKVSEDKADFRLFQLIQILMDANINIIFVSGREGTEQCYHDTIEWLKKYLVNYHVEKPDGGYDKFQLFMRKEKDYRPDEIIKQEIYNREINGKYDVICVFDDRNKVVDMWRNTANMLCCQVNDGDF